MARPPPSRVRTYVRLSIKGHPHRWFTDAIARRDLATAKSTARELGQLNVVDALSLLVLMAEQRDPAYERWAARWLARLIMERRSTTITVADQATIALVSLNDGEEDAVRRLSDFCAAVNLQGVAGLEDSGDSRTSSA